MKRRWMWFLAVAVVLILLSLATISAGVNGWSSSLSRDENGLYLARRILEETNVEVAIRDQPLKDLAGEAVLVLAFPWQQSVGLAEMDAVNEFLIQGGNLIFAYHGAGSRPGIREGFLLDLLGLHWDSVADEPSLWPPTWYQQQAAENELESVEGESEDPKLLLGVQRWAPEPPGGSRVLYVGDQDQPLIFDFSFRRGQVLVLPVEVLSNSRLTQLGNADWLMSQAAGFDAQPWIFDEYHHGLISPEVVASEPRFAWDLFVLHVAVIYLLGVLALGLRFGPAWRLRPLVTGSTASFLENLGGLHDRLGHYRQAAIRLVERRAAHASRQPLAEDLAAAENVSDGPQLVSLATELAGRHRSLRRLSRGESLES